MSLTDFLFSGSPPPSVNTYSSTTPSLPPWFESYQQGLLGKANVVAAEPYQGFTAPSGAAYDALKEARIAPFQPATQTGWQMGMDAATGYQPDMMAAENTTNAAANGPTAYGTAQPTISGALSSPGALNTATPALNAGTQDWPSMAAQYMNPFTDQAANRIAELSNRNLFENVMPGINDNFVKSGMFGSSRQGDFTNRAVRDSQDSLNGALGTLYAGQYNNAASQFGADANRDLTAGQTAGQLASTDMQNQLSAGSLQGNLTNVDRTTAGTLGQDQAALGSTGQRLGITGAGVYEGIGNQQQGQQQQLLDTMYNNFLEQRQYPKDQTTFMNNMIRGLQAPTATSTTTTAPASSYQAAPFAQLLGAGLGLSSLFGKTAADGGYVADKPMRRLARGGYLSRSGRAPAMPRERVLTRAPMEMGSAPMGALAA